MPTTTPVIAPPTSRVARVDVQRRQDTEADDGVAGDETQQPDRVDCFGFAAGGDNACQFLRL